MKNRFLKTFCFVLSFLIVFTKADISVAGINRVSLYHNSVDLIQNGDMPLYSSTTFSIKGTLSSAKQLIIEGLQNADEEINISDVGLPASDIGKVYQDVMNSHPELFYVGFEYGYTCDTNGFIEFVYPTYTMSVEEIVTKKLQYSEEIDNIVSKIDTSFSDLEKIVFVHDYLCANFSYDETLSIFDAYSFFVGKTGVCQSYTLAFIAIMNELNINVGYAASDSMEHIWNVVQIDSNWYHIDITWDDTYKQTVCGQVKHSNLLLSDYGIESTGHKNWTSNINYSCSDSTYDTYFWNEIKLPFVWVGDTTFCMVDGACYSVDLDFGSLKFFHIDTDWMYSGLATHDGNLLCGYKNSIKVYDTAGAFLYDLYTTDSKNSIYGLNTNDGVLSFAEAQEYSSELQFNQTKQFINSDIFSVDLSPEIYDGTNIKKEIKSNLVKGESYTVSYKCNNDTGLAEIEITGIGNYCGKITFNFYICNKCIFIDKAEEIKNYRNQGNENIYYELISGSGYENVYGTGSVLQVYSTENNDLIDSTVFVLYGDLNGDSVCDVIDVSLAQLYLNGLRTYSTIEIYASTGTATDSLNIEQYQSIVNHALNTT